MSDIDCTSAGYSDIENPKKKQNLFEFINFYGFKILIKNIKYKFVYFCSA